MIPNFLHIFSSIFSEAFLFIIVFTHTEGIIPYWREFSGNDGKMAPYPGKHRSRFLRAAFETILLEVLVKSEGITQLSGPHYNKTHGIYITIILIRLAF